MSDQPTSPRPARRALEDRYLAAIDSVTLLSPSPMMLRFQVKPGPDVNEGPPGVLLVSSGSVGTQAMSGVRAMLERVRWILGHWSWSRGTIQELYALLGRSRAVLRLVPRPDPGAMADADAALDHLIGALRRAELARLGAARARLAVAQTDGWPRTALEELWAALESRSRWLAAHSLGDGSVRARQLRAVVTLQAELDRWRLDASPEDDVAALTGGLQDAFVACAAALEAALAGDEQAYEAWRGAVGVAREHLRALGAIAPWSGLAPLDELAEALREERDLGSLLGVIDDEPWIVSMDAARQVVVTRLRERRRAVRESALRIGGTVFMTPAATLADSVVSDWWHRDRSAVA